MSSTRQLFRLPKDWLLAGCPLAAYIGAFTRYLSERRHASITLRKYLGCLAHFGRWIPYSTVAGSLVFQVALKYN
jgi:hypothetical protein